MIRRAVNVVQAISRVHFNPARADRQLSPDLSFDARALRGQVRAVDGSLPSTPQKKRD